MGGAYFALCSAFFSPYDANFTKRFKILAEPMESGAAFVCCHLVFTNDKRFSCGSDGITTGVAPYHTSDRKYKRILVIGSRDGESYLKIFNYYDPIQVLIVADFHDIFKEKSNRSV